MSNQVNTDFENSVVALEPAQPVWDHFFLAHNIVVVGTRQAGGEYDMAPKHMSMPVGWHNYFGFVCTPNHRTYLNIKLEKEFTVSFPRPNQVLFTSLAAAPRAEDDSKPSLKALPTIPAPNLDCLFLKDAYVYLECTLNRLIDGFDENSLVVGKVTGAYVAPDALRTGQENDEALIARSPMLVYLAPRRFATVKDSRPFPYPAQFRR